jgi:N-acetylglucosaminyldiphosphoundecaprenol N-acetyl-beta-D-mannosaminyltransferase
MSTSINQPIRVAELSESVYVPSIPARVTPPTVSQNKKSNAVDFLDESNTRYAWNIPLEPRPDETANALAAPPMVASTIQEFPVPALPLTATKRELADLTPVSPPKPSETTADFTTETSDFEELCELIEQVPLDIVPMPPVPAMAKVWGIGYHAVTMDGALDYLEQVIRARQNAYAITSNLNYSMLCNRHPRLKAFTEKAALVLCDGMPALWRSKLSTTKLPERVTGSDLIYRLCERCADKRFKVYFYGAAEGVADKAAAALKQLYPKLQVVGVQCPPFHDSSAEQLNYQLSRIRSAKPDVLFVALGQPKGEYWIEDHLDKLGVPLSIQVGASFDFVAGNSVRAPKLMQSIGLEWLYRTWKDPYRLGPRYFSNFLYLLRALRQECIDRLDHRSEA